MSIVDEKRKTKIGEMKKSSEINKGDALHLVETKVIQFNR
jgi:hypothetical protein